MSRRGAGAGPKPVRPTTLLERSWPWIVIAGVLGGVVIALGTTLLRGAQEAGGSSSGAFVAISLVGVLALAAMGLAGAYSFRKRRTWLQEHAPGTMMTWLRGHVWLGLAATFAVLVHAWLYPITSRVTTGKVTLAILVVLVVSGIAWRIVYRTVPPRVATSVGNLSTKDTRARLEQVEVEIEKALAGSSDALRELAQARLAGTIPPDELERRATALALEEQGAWLELVALAERRDRYTGREPRQERYHRFLQGWKVLHLPLAVLLGASIAVHVADVLGVSQRVSADETDAFPDAGRCADCHADIVDEWRLAMHAIAQRNPTVVAQTALALERTPAFGRVCTNCHSPIGTRLAPSDVYPLPGEEGGAPILADGVTCWTCHALPETPTELRGAADAFPVQRAGARAFGVVFGPPLEGEPPLPVPDHDVAVGFMTDGLATFQLCGACHNVKVDLASPPDGFSVLGDDITEGTGEDVDEDGLLDENELQFVDENGNGIADLEPGSPELDIDGTNKLLDLVLQTTFDEWEDFVASDRFRGETCGTCHMPSEGAGPIVDDAPGGLALPDRERHAHDFVGVDYDLEPGHYAGLGVGGSDATEEVLAARDALISQAVALSSEVERVNARTLTASVRVRAGFIGHDFPTGFAFARQWWLEVTAETENGDSVCLLPVDPATGDVDRRGGIASPCGSGILNAPQEDLRPCDPRQVAAEFGNEIEAAGGIVRNANLVLAAPAPLTDCDPWLANYQKVLTDGDPEGTGRFVEVPYQSLLPDIVKLQARVADQQLMAPLKPFDLPETPFDDREQTFRYVFDTSDVRGQLVVVTFRLQLRHLPPYFLRALDGFYPGGLTGEILLRQMVVSTAATTETEPVSVPQA